MKNNLKTLLAALSCSLFLSCGKQETKTNLNTIVSRDFTQKLYIKKHQNTESDLKYSFEYCKLNENSKLGCETIGGFQDGDKEYSGMLTQEQFNKFSSVLHSLHQQAIESRDGALFGAWFFTVMGLMTKSQKWNKATIALAAIAGFIFIGVPVTSTTSKTNMEMLINETKMLGTAEIQKANNGRIEDLVRILKIILRQIQKSEADNIVLLDILDEMTAESWKKVEQSWENVEKPWKKTTSSQ